MSLTERGRIHEEAKARMRSLNFGDVVTNVCTSEDNPHHFAYFVEFKVTSRRNRYGITHNEYNVRLTDRKGKFWNGGMQVTYPGRLTKEECERLYAPIWEAEFG